VKTGKKLNICSFNRLEHSMGKKAAETNLRDIEKAFSIVISKIQISNYFELPDNYKQ
jgi:hypothetical protein